MIPALGIALGVIVLGALTGFSARGPWDDAYMFVRYAANLIDYHALAWNPGAEPSYGLTSPVFLLIVAPLSLLIGGSPALVLVLSSALGGVTFLVLLGFAVYRYVDGSQAVRRVIVLFVFVVVAMTIHRFAPHLVSGMETTCALAFLAAYIVLLKAHEARPTGRSTGLLAGWSGLAYWVRPDLLLYTLGVPLALVAFGPPGKSRRHAVWISLTAILVTAVEVTVSWSYFQSPLPLAFYAKAMPLYGDFIYSRYRFFGVRELGHYLESYWPFLGTLTAAGLIEGRGWWRRCSAGEKGLLLASAAFLLYYAVGVLQIMGYHQRFYYPTLPALAFLGARAIGGLIHQIGPSPIRLTRMRWLLPVLVATILLPQTLVMGERLVRDLETGWVGRFDIIDHYRSSYQHWWFKLDEFSRLPDDLVMATTEIGLPAALNPRKRILDLAGLNEREIAHGDLAVVAFVHRERPDLLYLPHPDYREMTAQLRRDPGFIASYEVLDASALGAGMGVALRRGSKHYPAMRVIVGDAANALPGVDAAQAR